MFRISYIKLRFEYEKEEQIMNRIFILALLFVSLTILVESLSLILQLKFE